MKARDNRHITAQCSAFGDVLVACSLALLFTNKCLAVGKFDVFKLCFQIDRSIADVNAGSQMSSHVMGMHFHREYKF